MRLCFATEDDCYRKPNTGMWDVLERSSWGSALFVAIDSTLKVLTTDRAVSFYCGDAAGRKEDFSNSDKEFAKHAGLLFKTPEDVFEGISADVSTLVDAFDPFTASFAEGVPLALLTYPSHFERLPDIEQPPFQPAPGLEVVVLVGFPGSGKSMWSQKTLPHYSRVNQVTCAFPFPRTTVQVFRNRTLPSRGKSAYKNADAPC